MFLGSQLVASAVWSGSTPSYQFFAVDHLGSTRLATDVAGTVVETYKYWPYGDDGPGTGKANQRLTFDGMERDSENKHYYDHARTQDFNLGRFTAPEPVWVGYVLNPKTWNRYSFCLSNPLGYEDGDGQFALPIIGVVTVAGGLYGAAEGALEHYAETGEWSFSAAGNGFLVGAGTTLAAVGLTELIGSAVAAGAIMGGVTEYVSEAVTGRDISPLSIGFTTLTGAGAGGVAEFLGPRPGTYEANLFTPRTMATLMAGRNVTRQTFSEIAGGAVELLGRFNGRSFIRGIGGMAGTGMVGPGSFMLEWAASQAEATAVNGHQECYVTPNPRQLRGRDD